MGIIVWISFDLGCRKLENLVLNRVGPGLRAAQPHQKFWGNPPLTQPERTTSSTMTLDHEMSLQIFANAKKKKCAL